MVRFVRTHQSWRCKCASSRFGSLKTWVTLSARSFGCSAHSKKRRLSWRFVHDWICFFELDIGSQSCGKFDSFIHKCPSALRLMRAEFFGSQKCSQVSHHMPMIRNVTRWLFQKGCMRCREWQKWCGSRMWYCRLDWMKICVDLRSDSIPSFLIG